MDRAQRRQARFDETLVRGERRSLTIDCTDAGYVNLRDDDVTVAVHVMTPRGRQQWSASDDCVTITGQREVSVAVEPDQPGVHELRVFIDDGDERTALPIDGAIKYWVEPS